MTGCNTEKRFARQGGEDSRLNSNADRSDDLGDETRIQGSVGEDVLWKG
jgi:hypothetical protein